MARSNSTPDAFRKDEAAPVVIDAGQSASVLIPGGGMLANARFVRHGGDLEIIGADGSRFVIRDYFNQSPPPALHGENGAVIPGDLAQSLAGPLAPGQFAQAQGGSELIEIGVVDKLTGTATVRHVDGTTSTLRAGQPIYKGDVIETPSGGAVGVVFADRSTFAIGSGSRMVLDDMVYDPSSKTGHSSISVTQGSFSFVSGQIAKSAPESMTIRTPAMVIGVRGTAGAGKVNDGGGTDVVMTPDPNGFIGQITVQNSGGVTVINQPFQLMTMPSFSAPHAPPTPVPPSYVNQNFEAVQHTPAPPPPTQEWRTVPGQQEKAPTPEQLQQNKQQQQGQGEAKGEGVAAAEKAAAEKAAAEKAAAEKAALEQAAAEKVALQQAAEKAALEKVAAEKAALEKVAAEKAALEKAALEKAALEKAALEKAALEKAALEKAALEKVALEKAALEKAALEKAALDKAALDKAALEKAALEKAALVPTEPTVKFLSSTSSTSSTTNAPFSTTTLGSNSGGSTSSSSSSSSSSGGSTSSTSTATVLAEIQQSVTTSVTTTTTTTSTSSSTSSSTTTSSSNNSGTTSGSTSSSTNNTPASSAGRVVDGPVAGATVFRDMNNNRQLDAGEDSTTTDASGNYTLAGSGGTIVSIGGTDTDTGLPVTVTLSAPAGATVVTPLTTMVVAYGGDEAKVRTLFGITDSSVNLNSFDPAAGSSTLHKQIQAAGVQLVATIAAIKNGLASVGTNVSEDQIFSAIKAAMPTTPSAAFDLTSTTNLTEIIQTRLPAVTNTSLSAGALTHMTTLANQVSSASNAAKTTAQTGGDLTAVMNPAPLPAAGVSVNLGNAADIAAKIADLIAANITTFAPVIGTGTITAAQAAVLTFTLKNSAVMNVSDTAAAITSNIAAFKGISGATVSDGGQVVLNTSTFAAWKGKISGGSLAVELSAGQDARTVDFSGAAKIIVPAGATATLTPQQVHAYTVEKGADAALVAMGQGDVSALGIIGKATSFQMTGATTFTVDQLHQLDSALADGGFTVTALASGDISAMKIGAADIIRMSADVIVAPAQVSAFAGTFDKNGHAVKLVNVSGDLSGFDLADVDVLSPAADQVITLTASQMTKFGMVPGPLVQFKDPPTASAVPDGALAFNGADGIGIPVSAATKFASADNFTIAMWVNPSAAGTLFRQFAYLNELGIKTVLTADGRVELGFDAMSSGGWHTTLTEPNLVAFNEWSHIAVTKNGAVAKILVNGQEVGSMTLTGNWLTRAETTHVTTFGTNLEGQYYTGKLGDLKIFGSALSAADLAKLAKGDVASATPLADWGFDDSAGLDRAGLHGAITPTANVTLASGRLSIPEDQAFTGMVNVSDPNGKAVTWSITDAPDHGSVVLDAAKGRWVYTPAADWSGTDTFTLRFTNSDGAWDEETFSVVVTPVDDAPVLTDHAIATPGTEDEVFSFTVEDFEAGFFDAENGTLDTIRFVELPAHGKLMLGNDEVTTDDYIGRDQIADLHFHPDTNWHGTVTLKWKGYVGATYSAPATLSFTLASVADAPPQAEEHYRSEPGNEDETMFFSSEDFPISGGDGPLHSIKITSLPDYGVLKLDGALVTVDQVIAVADIGKLAFHPEFGWSGATGFGWAASDDGATFGDPSYLSFSLNPVNDAPILGGTALELSEGAAVNGGRLVMNGTNGEAIAELPHNALDNTFTLEFSVILGRNNVQQDLARVDNADNLHHRVIAYVDGQGKLALFMDNEGDESPAEIVSNVTLSTGVEYDIAVTFDHGAAKVFLNGVQVLAASYAVDLGVNQRLVIGSDGGNWWTQGSFADIQLWDFVRPAGDIGEPATGATVGLIGAWSGATTHGDMVLSDHPPSPVLEDINVNDTESYGVFVGDLVSQYGSDDGNGSMGIALTGLDNSHGHWEYMPGEDEWLTIPAVSEGAALLLSYETMIRFVPGEDWTGAATFQFRLWDGTSGQTGEFADTTVANGGSSAFGSTVVTVTQNVANLNDTYAVTLENGQPTSRVFTDSNGGEDTLDLGALPQAELDWMFKGISRDGDDLVLRFKDEAGGAGITLTDHFAGKAIENVTTGGGSPMKLATGPNGTAADEMIVGEAGDTVLVGGGGDDEFFWAGGSTVSVVGDGGDGLNFAMAASGVVMNSWDDAHHSDGTITMDAGATTVNFTGINWITGSQHDDVLRAGSSGYWQLAGGKGNDSLYGYGPYVGARTIASYEGDADADGVNAGDGIGVTVNLHLGTATDGWGGTDTLVEIGGAHGSAFDDTLIGSNHQGSWFAGMRGADTITGGNSYDKENWDTAAYNDDPTGIEVNLTGAYDAETGLASGQARDGWGDIDTLTSIEYIQGSRHADIVKLGNGPQGVNGGAGNDTLNGGAGIDTVSYASHDDTPPLGVAVNLSGTQRTVMLNGEARTVDAGTAIDQWDGRDVISDFEVAFGSDYDDVLIGGLGDNWLEGGNGDDVFYVRTDEQDTVDGGGGFDTVKLDDSVMNGTLDLTTRMDSAFDGIDAFDLTGAGTNTLILNADRCPSGTITILGDADDSIILKGAGWTSSAADGEGFVTWNWTGDYAWETASFRTKLDVDNTNQNVSVLDWLWANGKTLSSTTEWTSLPSAQVYANSNGNDNSPVTVTVSLSGEEDGWRGQLRVGTDTGTTATHLSFSGTLAEANAWLGSLQYRPDSNAPAGSRDYYTVHVTDGVSSMQQGNSLTMPPAPLTFTGTGQWNDGSRWDGGTPASFGDYAILGSGATATLGTNGGATVGRLSALSLASLTIAGSLNVEDILNVGNLASVTIEGEGALVVGGETTMSGTLTRGDAAVADFEGQFTLTGAGTVTIGDQASATFFDAVTLNGGTMTVNGEISLTDGYAMTIATAATLHLGNGGLVSEWSRGGDTAGLVQNSGHITMDGTATLGVALENTGEVVFDAATDKLEVDHFAGGGTLKLMSGDFGALVAGQEFRLFDAVSMDMDFDSYSGLDTGGSFVFGVETTFVAGDDPVGITLVARSATNGTAGADGTDVLAGDDTGQTFTNIGDGDMVYARGGEDIINLTSLNFDRIDGGEDFDTLVFAAGSMVNFGLFDGYRIDNIEKIEFGDAGGQFNLQAEHVRRISGSDTLTIGGDSDTILNLIGTWTPGTTQDGYTTYSQSGAQIVVNDAVTMNFDSVG